jgi:hypothetical protein
VLTTVESVPKEPETTGVVRVVAVALQQFSLSIRRLHLSQPAAVAAVVPLTVRQAEQVRLVTLPMEQQLTVAMEPAKVAVAVAVSAAALEAQARDTTEAARMFSEQPTEGSVVQRQPARQPSEL